MNTLLSSQNLTILKKDPTTNFNTQVKDIIDSLEIIINDIYQKRRLIIMNPQAPKLYGTIKLHKDNHPTRPVVDYTHAPTVKIAKFLVNKLKQEIKFNPIYTVKNSYELIDKLSKQKLNNNTFRLISFDVTNMFPNIPTQETIQIINNLLHKQNKLPTVRDELITLLSLCLNQNYFKFNNTYYTQNTGLPMGSPLSPLIADIFMDNLETYFLKTPISKKHIIFWFRYVDDVLVGFNGTDRQLDIYLNTLNALHSNIKFTVEIEQTQSINFLDLNISRTEGGFSFKIYRKPTTTDTTIPFDSYSPIEHKLAAYRSLIHRAFTIPISNNNLRSEINIIKLIAYNNGFPLNMIDKLIRKKERQIIIRHIYPAIPDTTIKNFIAVPYIKTISQNIKNIFVKNNIHTAFTNNNNMSRIIYNAKEKTDVDKKCGVYSLTCPECSSIYIGQTGRTFITRYKEHIKPNSSSNFMQHLIETNHKLTPNHNIKPLHICEKSKKLNLLECLEINKINNTNSSNLLNDQIDINNSPLLNLNLVS